MNLSAIEQSAIFQTIDHITVFNFPLSKLLLAISIFVIVFVLGEIIAKLTNRYLLYFNSKFESNKKKKSFSKIKYILSSIQPSAFKLILLYAVKVSMQYIGIWSYPLSNIMNSFIIIMVFVVLIKVASFFIETYGHFFAQKTESSLDDALLPLLHKLSQAFLAIWALILLLRLWNVDISPVIGGLGLAGLAASLALKDTLNNLFGGVSLLVDNSFKIGDRIYIKESDIDGKVLDIGLRSTKILTWDNEVIFVPNGTLANSTVKNFLLPDAKVRVVVDFDVAYGSDVDEVKEIVLTAIRDLDFVGDDPAPQVIFKSMEDYSLKFQAKFWVIDVWEAYDAKLRAIDIIYKELTENNIDIPFPTQTIKLEK